MSCAPGFFRLSVCALLAFAFVVAFLLEPAWSQELKGEKDAELLEKKEDLGAIGFEEVKEAGRSLETALEVPYPCRVRGFMDKGDYDTYKIVFTGGLMRVASRGPLDLVVDLKDANGVTLARAGQDAAVEFVLERQLPPGKYYLQVRVMYHLAAGAYELLLGKVDARTTTVQEGSLSQ